MEINEEKEMIKSRKIAKILTKIYGIILLSLPISFLISVTLSIGNLFLVVVLLAPYPIIFGGIIVVWSWIIYGLDLLILKEKNRKKESNKDLR